ncbi:questin oxidase family protein [Roseateles sp. BYS180W]|uniref:Questin oxidase family protein n=1 Tax=Roseateles rivi TaxID=3299028 RepID=A0ABW7FSP2_9BURK
MNPSTAPTPPLSALHQALDACQTYAPTYDGLYSNHLPMALHAAWQLGADAQRLQAQLAHDTPELQPLPELSAAQPLDDWREGLGQAQAYAALRASLQQKIAQEGPDAVLRQCLVPLLGSAHSTAFHGLIRTAHAWESAHLGELASALAAWACDWAPLPQGQTPQQSMPLQAWWAAVCAELGEFQAEQNMIQTRMEAATQAPLYQGLAEAAQAQGSLAQLCQALQGRSLTLYVQTGNFTVLHLLTATRALRVLLPWVEASAALDAHLQAVWLRSALAALMASGVARARPLPEAPSPLPDWPVLRAAALAQYDEHTLKLVHCGWQEDARQSDPRWRQAAALRLWGEARCAPPPLDDLDHIHVQVRDRAQAERWYAQALGLTADAQLLHWAPNGGPLTLRNASGQIKLALFEHAAPTPGATVALRVSPTAYAQWRARLQATPGLAVEEEDHGLSQSLYFQDPDGNAYEITCYGRTA